MVEMMSLGLHLYSFCHRGKPMSKYRLFLTMLMFVSALFRCAYGQTSATDIAVRLSLPTSMPCLGDAVLPVDLILTNNSSHQIEISPDGFYSNVLLTKFRDGNPTTGGGRLAEIIPKRWVRLAPRQSYVVSIPQSLGQEMSGDKSFFSTVGLFAIQDQFAVFIKTPNRAFKFVGSTRSNSALFTLKSCK